MLLGGNSFQSHCTPATYPMLIRCTMFYHRCVAKIRPHGIILQRRTISKTMIQKKTETYFHYMNAYIGFKTWQVLGKNPRIKFHIVSLFS